LNGIFAVFGQALKARSFRTHSINHRGTAARPCVVPRIHFDAGKCTAVGKYAGCTTHG